MSFFEDGCTQPTFTAGVAAPYQCPNTRGFREADYGNSDRYVEVCDISQTDIVYYKFSVGDHSAVRDTRGGQVKYLSKYGSESPLIGHDIDGTWYHLKGDTDSSRDFYSYVDVQGDANITGTDPVTFSANSNAQLTYAWTIASTHGNAYITSGANQPTVTIQPSYSGEATLTLNVTSDCGTMTRVIDLDIDTETCLEGKYGTSTAYNRVLGSSNSVSAGSVQATVWCPNATRYTWVKTSGNTVFYTQQGPTANFTIGSGDHIGVRVSAFDGNSLLAARTVSFYSYGAYRASPNPSNEYINVEVAPELRALVTLESQTDRQSYEYTIEPRRDRTIDISALPSGKYALTIEADGEKPFTQQVTIK